MGINVVDSGVWEKLQGQESRPYGPNGAKDTGGI
jgi:hypothetical protein